MRRVTTTDDEAGFSSSSVMAGQKLVFVRRPPSLCVSGPASVAAAVQRSGGCPAPAACRWGDRPIDCIETDQITGVSCSHQAGPHRLECAVSSCAARHTTPHCQTRRLFCLSWSWVLSESLLSSAGEQIVKLCSTSTGSSLVRLTAHREGKQIDRCDEQKGDENLLLQPGSFFSSSLFQQENAMFPELHASITY